MSARIASARSIALLGLEGYGVDVEAHVGRGLVAFTLVGLPDASLREAKDRVRSALQAIECEVFDVYITVNLENLRVLYSTVTPTEKAPGWRANNDHPAARR